MSLGASDFHTIVIITVASAIMRTRNWSAPDGASNLQTSSLFQPLELSHLSSLFSRSVSSTHLWVILRVAAAESALSNLSASKRVLPGGHLRSPQLLVLRKKNNKNRKIWSVKVRLQVGCSSGYFQVVRDTLANIDNGWVNRAPWSVSRRELGMFSAPWLFMIVGQDCFPPSVLLLN